MNAIEIQQKYAIDDAAMMARIREALKYPHLLNQLVEEINSKKLKVTARERELINRAVKERNDRNEAKKRNIAKRRHKTPGGWIL
jgi:hypothetical protein